MALQLSVVLLGFPSQIARNYRDGRCGETSLKLGLVFATFSSRFVNTGFDGVWYIFIPDSFAIVLIGITLWQLKSPRNFAARAVNTAWDGVSDLVAAFRIAFREFRK
jgi:hypothetical protein